MQGVFWNGELKDAYWGHIISEIYKEKVYDKYFDGKSGLVVVDIGANVGLTSYYFSQYASKVISLEPAKEHFECIQEMIKYNKITNIIPINKAIYINDGEFDLFHNENRTMYSLHMAVDDRKEAPEKVQAITLKTLFEEQKLEHVDFVKLDVEGSEQEILGHVTFGEVADKIGAMLIENHNWNGRHPNQLKEALRNRGFKVEQMPADANLLFASK